jgi:hypothetical protein
MAAAAAAMVVAVAATAVAATATPAVPVASRGGNHLDITRNTTVFPARRISFLFSWCCAASFYADAMHHFRFQLRNFRNL